MYDDLPDLILSPFTKSDVDRIRNSISCYLNVRWRTLPATGKCIHPNSPRAEFRFYNYFDALEGLRPNILWTSHFRKAHWERIFQELLDEFYERASQEVRFEDLRQISILRSAYAASRHESYWMNLELDEASRFDFVKILAVPMLLPTWRNTASAGEPNYVLKNVG